MPNLNTVEFLPLNEDASIPKHGSVLAAGYDLHASEDVTIEWGSVGLIPLGFATAMPEGIHGRIESRSGWALKGYVVLTGVIDADYRGEWKVIMGNFSGQKLDVKKGDRVAQVVFRDTVQVAFHGVSELSESARGAGGFGSTGAR